MTIITNYFGSFGVKLYRFVNNEDIVPRVPPRGVYAHVGDLRFISGDGILRDNIVDNEPSNKPTDDETIDHSSPDQPESTPNSGLVPAGFRDHVPLLYAIHLWNNLSESRP